MTRSPPAAAVSRTPLTAPPNRRGGNKTITLNNPFSNVRSSPSTGVSGPGKTLRKRSRTGGFDGAPDEEDEAYRKGPHTLRKRAKIDYSAADFEDELPEIAIPAPRTATRKRRAESEVADDDYFTPASQKRRATSRDFSLAALPAARRRTPARKSIAEQQSFYSQPSDEDIVKDTIEVIGDSSDLVSSDASSDHEEEQNAIRVGGPAPHDHEFSSPTQRKGHDAHQLVSPAHQQVVKKDEKLSDQIESVTGTGTAASSSVAAHDPNPGHIIAHPQPIHVNQPTIINADQAEQHVQPVQTPTRRGEPTEEFSVQPKLEASSPVRPTVTAPQKAIQPEAAESAVEQPNVNGTQQSIATAATTGLADAPATAISAIIANTVGTTEPAERVPALDVQPTVNGETINGHIQATEVVGPLEDKNSSEPAPNVKISDSFLSQQQDVPFYHDEITVDPAHISDAVPQKDAATEEPELQEEEKEEESAPPVEKTVYQWSYLTPYIEGEYVTHSIYPVMVEGSAPMSNVDANDTSAYADAPEDQADTTAEAHTLDVDEDGHADAEGEPDEAEREADHDEDHPSGSQGQQMSQESTYNSAAPTPALTPRQGSPVLPAPTGASTPALPGMRQRFRKQYRYDKIRDPAEFIEFLKDHKDISYEELWELLAHVNKTLVTWQEEYKVCTKIVDDQENAQRRSVQDAAFEKKTSDLDAFSKVESYIEKDFDVQGYRATIKEKDAGTLEQRWQDRVMASVYGFEYDPHPNKIGNQDPDAQRDGGGEGRQLRSQPQASAKAAEGDGVIVSGKRTRNPPKMFDGVLQDDARSATPGGVKPGPGPKRRSRAAAAEKASFTTVEEPEPQPQPQPQPEPEVISPAKGRKRGPRGKRAVVVESEPDTPAPEEEAIAPSPPPPPEPEHSEAPTKRKRGRQSKAQPVEEPKPRPEETTPKRGRAAAKRQSNGTVAAAPETTDESRPTSSSSNATVSDEGSTYGLRQKKRQRNWREEADVDEEAVEATHHHKKPRIRINRKQSAQELALKQSVSERILSDMHDFSTPATPDVPQLMVSFKHMGNDQWTVKGASTPRHTSTDVSEYNASTPLPAPASAPASAKSSAPPSQAGGEEKDYSTMTKSEKMSASMKKRWLNGSMQGAVNKRKATLAAKKAAAAAAEAQAAQNQTQVAQQNTIHFPQHTGILPMPPSQPQ
ncbi:hypothetical protein C8034_v003079 [Colletotrichum sidae]|uniref:Uncharacterized protein n=1 Tax=Colletotrichum sidae TaxID=1347389 RepID=A0A4R8T8X2_9PEZI|nr:hypothetical protein C8034_v003079 [Colletotrichum sidae]